MSIMQLGMSLPDEPGLETIEKRRITVSDSNVTGTGASWGALEVVLRRQHEML